MEDSANSLQALAMEMNEKASIDYDNLAKTQ
jgi:hypothetical protein